MSSVAPNLEPVAIHRRYRESKDDIALSSSASVSGSINGFVSVTSSRPSSASRTSRPRSAGRSGGPSSASAAALSKKVEQHAVRKIASAGLRKKREDAMRIERENKIMQSRLQKFATSKPKDVVAPTASRNPYASTTAISSAPVALAVADSKNDGSRVTRPGSASVSASACRAMAVEDKGVLSDKELLDILRDIKQKIVDTTNDSADLRAQLSKNKIQASRLQQSNERIKRTTMGNDAKGYPDGLSSSSISSPSAISRREGGANTAAAAVTNESDAKSIPDRSKLKQYAATVAARSDKSWVFEEYGLIPEKIADKELLDVAEEHVVLQNLRRNLIHRMETAKHAMLTTSYVSKSIDAKNRLALQRLQLWFPSHSKTILRSVNDRRASNSATAADAKDANKTTAASAAAGIASTSSRKKIPVNPELDVYQRLVTARAEYDLEKSLYDEGIPGIDLQSQLQESRAVVANLTDTREALRHDIVHLQYERDLWQEKLNAYIESDCIQEMREDVGRLREQCMRLSREKRVADLLDDL